MVIFILMGICSIDKSENALGYFKTKEKCEEAAINRDERLFPLYYCQQGYAYSKELQ